MRSSNWPEVLDVYIRQRRDVAFGFAAPGVDCLKFADDCALAMGSTPFMSEWDRAYTTEAGAVKKLLQLGCSDDSGRPSLPHYLGERLEAVAVSHASRGDIALLPWADTIFGHITGIIVGTHAVSPREGVGLYFWPRHLASHAYRLI